MLERKSDERHVHTCMYRYVCSSDVSGTCEKCVLAPPDNDGSQDLFITV